MGPLHQGKRIDQEKSSTHKNSFAAGLSKQVLGSHGRKAAWRTGVSKVTGYMPLKNSLTYSSGLSVVVIVVVDMVVLSTKK